MNKITHYSVILVLVSALLLLPACTPVTDNSDAHIVALITELRSLLNSLYNSQTKTIYPDTNSDNLIDLSVKVTAIQEAGAANKIASEQIQITALRTGFNDKVSEFHTQFADLNAKVETTYTADSWKAFTEAKIPIDELTPCTYGKITEKIDTITAAISFLVTKDDSGSENPPTEPDNPGTPENPETPPVDPEPEVGDENITIIKKITYNGILDAKSIDIKESVTKIEITLEKGSSDKISMGEASQFYSDLKNNVDGRTVTLNFDPAFQWTLNGSDVSKLVDMDYGAVSVRDESIMFDYLDGWMRPVKKREYEEPNKVITIKDGKHLSISGDFKAFFTKFEGAPGSVKSEVGDFSDVKLYSQHEHSFDLARRVLVTITTDSLKEFIKVFDGYPAIDVSLKNKEGASGYENLYETLWPLAENYVNKVDRFNLQKDETREKFQTNGMTSSNESQKMFNVSDLNNSWSTIDAEILMKFKQFGSVRNLIVTGTVPEGELSMAQNLAFTGDASKLTNVEIGGMNYFEGQPAKRIQGNGDKDHVIFKESSNNPFSVGDFDTINLLNIQNVSNISRDIGTIFYYSNYYSYGATISGIEASSISSSPPDYEKIWKESNGILSSKSSRVISAQQQKTR